MTIRECDICGAQDFHGNTITECRCGCEQDYCTACLKTHDEKRAIKEMAQAPENA